MSRERPMNASLTLYIIVPCRHFFTAMWAVSTSLPGTFLRSDAICSPSRATGACGERCNLQSCAGPSGNEEDQASTAAFATLHAHIPAVRPRDRPAERQAQSEVAGLRRTAGA